MLSSLLSGAAVASEGGEGIRQAQRSLRALGLPAPLSGRFDAETARSVCAWREVQGLPPSRIRPSAQEWEAIRGSAALAQPGTRMVKGVNVSKACQMGYWVQNGQWRLIFPVSTGAARTPSKNGTFRVSWRVNGWRESSSIPGAMLYKPQYFYRGQAIHGTVGDGERSQGIRQGGLVKTYPASAGCVRVHRAVADALFAGLEKSDRIRIYGSWQG